MSENSLKSISDKHFAWVEKMGWVHATPLESLALIASEVGEAVNECRGPAPTDKLGSELADIVLRVLGFAKLQGIDIEAAILAKMSANEQRGSRGRVI